MKTIRTALVNPPNTRAHGYEGESAPPPLGLAYIASVLRTHGCPADLFDFAECVDPDEEFLAQLDFFSYDVYGFTAYTKTFPGAIDLLRTLRRINRTAIVVFGGPHASPCAEEVVAEYPDIDVVVRNDGEYPMLELLQHIGRGEYDARDVAGLVYRDGGIAARISGEGDAAGGEVIRTADQERLIELDDLPFPARDYIFEPNRVVYEYRRHAVPAEMAFISSSRGCPKRCTFCSIIVMSPRYRTRSVESLMSEIIPLYESRPFGHISFMDANFFVNPARSLEFARTLHAWNPGVTWSGTATADMIVRHEEVLMEIGRLNCTYMEVGIESGSSAALKRYNKWTRVDQNLRAVAMLQRAGIDLELDFIMFDPETEMQDLRSNIAFLKDADLMGHQPTEHLYNHLKLYPGTPARENYITMFGLESHHLASMNPPFTDEKVGTVFTIVNGFYGKYQGVIDRSMFALDRFQRRCYAERHALRSREMIVELQRMAALLVRLRHTPEHFFISVLDGVDEGRIPIGATIDKIEDDEAISSMHRLLQQAEEILEETKRRHVAVA